MKTLLRSFRFALEGIGYVVRTQRNARVHLVIGGCAIALAAVLGLRPIEWAVLALTIGLVLTAEALNTVIELAVDLLTQRIHPMAKSAKDAGAGAVLIAAITAVAVGVFLFGPRLWALIVR